RLDERTPLAALGAPPEPLRRRVAARVADEGGATNTRSGHEPNRSRALCQACGILWTKRAAPDPAADAPRSAASPAAGYATHQPPPRGRTSRQRPREQRRDRT